MIPYIQTQQGLTFIIDGRPKTIAADSPSFKTISQALADPNTDDLELEDLVRSDGELVVLAVRGSSLNDLTVNEATQTVLFKGEEIPEFVQKRILEMVRAGLPLQPIVNFLTLLEDNPSYRVVQRLFEFLDYGKMPLTEDGCFLAYKAVRKDWMDIHSGRISNHIGATPSVPRNKVDENQNRTCSYGLHLCSFDYLPAFAHADGHVVICKVNPADVVAIPTDYNNTKMRVCAYEVIDEVEDYYDTHRHVLGDSWLFSANGSEDLAFEAPYRDEVGFPDKWEVRTYLTRDAFINGDVELRETFSAVEEGLAREMFRDYVSNGDNYVVQLVDNDNNEVVQFYRDEALA
jgi:hypothetical protein